MNFGDFAHEKDHFAEGANAKVYVGWDRRSGDLVAVKQFRNPDNLTPGLHQEIIAAIGQHVGDL